MIALVPGPRGAGSGWRLVSRTGNGADVLARTTAGPDAASSRQALARLRDGNGTVSVVAARDGHLKWQLTSRDGMVIAESPAVHRDAASCRAAFTDAQRAAHVALGGSYARPSAA
ncbi:hypothetical protein AB0C29_01055 [Actinoplanes sp. NPDC048791]|uniref:hypothetical protein n=1 Tax=Actinoplanes sp. NPDC048791 TaxID=3154623 RepID=UPI00340AB2B2